MIPFHNRSFNVGYKNAFYSISQQFPFLYEGIMETSHGLDIDSQGNGEVREQRMYQLIRQPGTIADREFQIEFIEPEVEVYDFTFG